MKFSYISILFFLISGISNAQRLADTIRIGEVKVLGQRKTEEIGLTKTRPDSMAMVSMATAHLSELLSQYSPVFIKSYGRGSEATASFRGTAASHTKVEWNGMPVNSPMRGSVDLSLFPVLFADDAFLLHGGSSLAESSGALGGSIHLSNNAQWNVIHSINASIERGSFGTGRYMAKVQTGTQKFRSVTRFLYDHSQNDFPFYNVGVLPYRDDTLKNADYSKWAALQEFYLQTGENSMAVVRGWFQKSNRNLPQLMSYEGSGRIEYQDDEQLRAQVEFKNFGKPLKFRYSGGLNHTKLRYFRSSTESGFVNDDALSKENSLYNKMLISRAFGQKINLSASAEANYHWIDTYNEIRQTGYNENRFEAGLMAHFQYKIGPKTGLFALIRSEIYDNKWAPLIPSLGVEFQLSEKQPILLKINASRNYHKPSLNDLYWLPGGNPDLLPEDGKSADMVFSMESKKQGLWKQEITVFASLIDNWIIWQPAANGAWFWEATNVKKVFSRGIEYQAQSRFHIKKVQIFLSGNYAFTLTTNQNAVSSVDQSRGKQLIYIPKHTGNLHGAATLRGWTLKGDLSYTGRRYTQSSNQWSHFESVLNPFWLASAALEKNFNINHLNFTALAKIENLFDTGYQQILWRPMPGRHYSVTLSMKLQ